MKISASRSTLRAAVAATAFVLIGGIGGATRADEAAPAAASTEPSATDKESARALVGVGNERTKSGDLGGALEAFRQAHAIMRVPTTGVLVGQACERVGLLLDAHDAYVQTTLIPKQSKEPAAFAKARKRAAERIEELKGKVPSLVVSVESADGTPLEDVKVIVDGVDLTGIVATLPRKLNPGSHRVSASAKRHRAEPVELTLAPSESRPLRIVLQPRPPEPIATPVVPAPTTAQPTTPSPPSLPAGVTRSITRAAPPPSTTAATAAATAATPPDARNAGTNARAMISIKSGSSPKPWIVWGSYGVGAAALVAGAVTGGLSLSAASRALELCPSKVGCGEEARPDHDRAIALANASNVALALAGVGAIAGTVTLFVLPGSALGDRERGAAVVVRPYLGPGSLGVTGTF